MDDCYTDESPDDGDGAGEAASWSDHTDGCSDTSSSAHGDDVDGRDAWDCSSDGGDRDESRHHGEADGDGCRDREADTHRSDADECDSLSAVTVDGGHGATAPVERAGSDGTTGHDGTGLDAPTDTRAAAAGSSSDVRPLVPLDLGAGSAAGPLAVPAAVTPTSFQAMPGIDAATGSLLDRAAGVGGEAIDFVERTFGPGTYRAAERRARANGTIDHILTARGIEDPAERFFRTEQDDIERHNEVETRNALDGSSLGSLSNGL